MNDPRFIIALMVIGLFGWVVFADPADETIRGALIAGFAGAWGYYLGSSRGTSEANARTDKALDVAVASAAPSVKVDPPATITETKTTKVEAAEGGAVAGLSETTRAALADDAGELPESERLP